MHGAARRARGRARGRASTRSPFAAKSESDGWPMIDTVASCNHQPTLPPSYITTTSLFDARRAGKVPLTRCHASTSCACGVATTTTPYGSDPAPADVTIRAYAEAEKGLRD